MSPGYYGKQKVKQGEQWCMVAPLLGQKDILPINKKKAGWTDIFEFLISCKRMSVFEKLARLDHTESSQSRCYPSFPQTIPKTKLLGFEALPTELQELILYDNVLTPQDVVNLGLCSTSLWAIILEHLRTRRLTGLWAGTPLIITGTWLNDFPPAMVNLFPGLKDVQDAYRPAPYGPARQTPVPPARQWNSQAVQAFASTRERKKWLSTLNAPSIANTFSPQKIKVLRAMLEHATRTKHPQAGEKWALRNLTTHEYIRLEVDMINKDFVHAYVASTRWLTLDAALTIRIRWTADNTVRRIVLKRGLGLVEVHVKLGTWAAHCFDVVPLSNWAGDKAWEDVTASILIDARNLGMDRAA